MNHETKKFDNINTDKTINTPMDDKTRAEYRAESYKIPAQAFSNSIIAGVALALINLVNLAYEASFSGSILGELADILGYSIFIALFVFIASLCILRSKLNTKYKIPNIYQKSHINETKLPLPSLNAIWSSDLDLDSTMPGSAANCSRRAFDDTHQSSSFNNTI